MNNNFQNYLDKIGEVGEVTAVKSSVATANGLPNAFLGERILTENGVWGLIFSIDEDKVEFLTLSHGQMRIGEKIVRTGSVFELEVGQYLASGIFDPLGTRIMGETQKAELESEPRAVDIEAMGLSGREDAKEFFQTGVAIVDLIIPIAKGQRELIIGDRKSGRSEFAIRAVATHASAGGRSIYCMIGKRTNYIERIIDSFTQAGVLDQICLMTTFASDPAGLIYMAPYSAMAVAEYFRDQGEDVLLVIDDLSTHSNFYREVSLISGRFPGRDSYPGDIFYTHSRLLERAGNFKTGSITALPIARILEGDLSGYIQTNLMSITDGHLFFDPLFFNEGKSPAVNPFLSVTRVGRQTQAQLQKELGREISTFLVDLKKLRSLMHFGAELTEKVQAKFNLGDRLESFFYLNWKTPLPWQYGLFLAAAIWKGWGKGKPQNEFEPKLITALNLFETNKILQEAAVDLATEDDLENYLLKIKEKFNLLEEENG